MIRSNALVSLVSLALAVSLGGCHLQATEGDPAGEDLRSPRICPAIAILCEDGYEARVYFARDRPGPSLDAPGP